LFASNRLEKVNFDSKTSSENALFKTRFRWQETGSYEVPSTAELIAMAGPMGFGVWSTAFGLAAGNIAIIVLAPSYFEQLITLGVLFQVLNAFSRVEGSMTFFIDRWTTIVDFQSVIKRLREFNKVLDEAELIEAAAPAKKKRVYRKKT